MRVIVDISDEEKACLDHALIDVQDWAEKALHGKAENCRIAVLREGVKVLQADPSIVSLPKDKEDLILLILSHPDYRNRNQREADALAGTNGVLRG